MTDYSEALEEQLFKALQADDKKTKNYHIRQTLQICDMGDVTEGVELNPETGKAE